VKKRRFTVAPSDPRRLGHVVAGRLSLSASEATARVAAGAVHLGGARVTNPDVEVPLGAVVTVFEGDPTPQPPADLVVRYRDPDVIVVDKPAGQPAQATRANQADALDARVQAELTPEARLLHRLDADASGLLLFAASARARTPLQIALERHQIVRRYLALVAGELTSEGRIALKIARDRSDARRRVALPERAPGGQPAVTRYRMLERRGLETLLALELETGRTHQLRVHLSALGHPIVGDRLYGGRDAGRLYLHAYELTFPHPGDGRSITVLAPPPAELAVAAP
jgi:23S rRNA pseudouridine1911/1915/1917 synthase